MSSLSVKRMNGDIRAVMFFCDSPKDVALWWADLIGLSSDSVIDDGEFDWFNAAPRNTDSILPTAERIQREVRPSCTSQTSDLSAAMEKAIALGAVRHRGPLVISPERSIL